jgi:uncharacterized LabA/DUF88 family protein
LSKTLFFLYQNIISLLIKSLHLKNLAFIDGQNLYKGTVIDGWKIDYLKFRIYLKDKYNIEKAYYFIGFFLDSEEKLYLKLEEAGFILVFKKHNKDIESKKKGNVDADIVFHVMREIIENKDFNKILIVSGDGDFKNVVDYLIEKNRFEKILFPNKEFASSLYKELRTIRFDYIKNLKPYIEHK